MTPGQQFTVFVLFPIGMLLAYLLSRKTSSETALEEAIKGAKPAASSRRSPEQGAPVLAAPKPGSARPAMGSIRPPAMPAAAAPTPQPPSPARALGSIFPPAPESGGPKVGSGPIPKPSTVPVFFGAEYIEDEFNPATALTTRLNEQSLASLVSAADAAGWSDEPAGEGPVVDAAALADPGLRRDHNADQVLCRPEKRLFAVVDGAGAAGPVASELVVEALYEAGQQDNVAGETYARQLTRALERAHHRLLEHGAAGGLADLGATALAAYLPFDERRVYVAHVGNCRAYRYRARVLEKLTTDHSLERHGETGAEGLKLTRMMGVGARYEAESVVDVPEPGDLYVLCTDGLWRMLADVEIREAIAEGGKPGEIAARLVAAANFRGGRDNIGVVVLRVE